MAKKTSTIAEIEQYIAFLQKRIDSKNYKSNASPEEYARTKEKLDRERLKLKLLKPPQKGR